MTPKKVTAEEFDAMFDSGEVDMTPYLDNDNVHFPGKKIWRVNVDFPDWVVEALDAEANRIGVTRQSIIKMWIVEKLEEKAG